MAIHQHRRNRALWHASRFASESALTLDRHSCLPQARYGRSVCTPSAPHRCGADANLLGRHLPHSDRRHRGARHAPPFAVSPFARPPPAEPPTQPHCPHRARASGMLPLVTRYEWIERCENLSMDKQSESRISDVDCYNSAKLLYNPAGKSMQDIRQNCVPSTSGSKVSAFQCDGRADEERGGQLDL